MKFLTSVLVCFLLTSCISTLYGPSNYKGGYKDVQVSEDVYEISIHGNAFTYGHSLKEFFLVRAAELTVENGGKYFVILRNAPGVIKSSRIAGNINSKGDFRIYEVPANRYYNNGKIRTLKELPTDADVQYYDANLILAKLAPTIKKSTARKNKK